MPTKKKTDAPTHTIVAIGPNAWGKGATCTAALKELRKAHGPGLRRWIVYFIARPPAEVWVDDFGGLCWNRAADETAPTLCVCIDRHDPQAKAKV